MEDCAGALMCLMLLWSIGACAYSYDKEQEARARGAAVKQKIEQYVPQNNSVPTESTNEVPNAVIFKNGQVR